ncbi:tetratricopeptide repeat protein [Acidicapsa ligni]|uniref:tetratricopeptide repeat protein n=1 Tax=Acidicapsa ligni TaxID=542300 RepID=UPI0021E096CD|nr:tetratricopeptide repeat protein [Acidicapsa ligni]
MSIAPNHGNYFDLAPTIAYSVDGIDIDIARGCVKRLGTEHYPRRQTFHVLLYLLKNHGHLVSKEELTTEIWQDTAVTDNALAQCIAEIRKVLGDDSRNPKYIKTVSKAGYCFVAPVKEFFESRFPLQELPGVSVSSPLAEVAQISPVVPEVSRPSSKPSIFVSYFPRSPKSTAYFLLIICVLLLVAGWMVWLRLRPVPMETMVGNLNNRSLAVMYFENETQHQNYDWLRQGFTDMMITDLSRSGQLHILSRQQLSQLVGSEGKDAEVSPDQAMRIAQSVRAADFVTGSFAEIDGHFRIDIQLHDTRNGQIVFADHSIFEHSSELLSQVDVLAEHLSNAMELNSVPKPNLGEAMTKNVEAYQYYSLGVQKAQEFENAEALILLKQAVEFDPQFAMAYARIGYTYALSDIAPEEGRPYLEKALQLSSHLSEKDRLDVSAWYAIARADYGTAMQTLNKINQLYPEEIEAYWRLARLLRAEERPEEAIAVLRRGIQVNPSDKDLNNTLGFVLLSMHRYSEAIAAHRHYVELAPNEPNAHDSLGMSYQQSGNYATALSEYNKALALDPDFEPSIVHLGDAYYQTQQYGKAINQYLRYIQVAHTTGARALGYGNLAAVYFATNRMGDAEQAAAKELKNDPRFVWNSLVIALKKSDATTAGRLERVLFKEIPSQERGAPGNQRTRFYYQGYIDMQSGKTQKALEDFKAALQHLPPSSSMDSYEDCLANAELQLGHYQEAETEYKRILQFDPNYPLARHHLTETEAHLDNQKNDISK